MDNNWMKKTTAFLSGQAVSLFGSALVQFAIIWHVTLESKSGAVLAIMTLCSFLPQLLVSIFGGVLADRYNRKKLIIMADASIAVATLILALAYMSGQREYWMLFAVLAVRSLGSGIQMPAVTAIIPQITPEDKLMKINGINGSIQSLVYLVSPAVGGAVLMFFPIETIFFIDVVTAVIGIGILFLIHIPTHEKAAMAQETDAWHDLKEGVVYTKNHDMVRELMIVYSIFMFLVVPAALLTPLLVTREFGEEVWKLSTNEILFSGGAVLGGIAVSVWGGFKNRVNTLAITCIGFGVLTVALSYAYDFYVYLAVVGVTGFIMPYFNSTGMVMFQQGVDQDMQGRVFGLVGMVSMGMMPLGMFVLGPLADHISIRILLLVSGVLMGLLGIAIKTDKRIPEE